MPAESNPALPGRRYLLPPERLRWRCDPAHFNFVTTADMQRCPIQIIGQTRAMEALELGLSMRSEGYNIFVTGEVGSGRSTVVKRMLEGMERGDRSPNDVVYVHNFADADEPRRLVLPARQGRLLRESMEDLVDSLIRDLRGLFDSDEYRRQRGAIVDQTTHEQKARLKEFEKRVQEHGFALVQVPMGPLTRPQPVPVVAGNPVDMDQLEHLVEQGQFKKEDLDRLQERGSELSGEMEALGKSVRNADRDLRRKLAVLDRDLARPLVEEAAGDVAASFKADGLELYLDQVVEDVLANLDSFRDTGERALGEEATPSQTDGAPTRDRYRVNVVVDNSKTKGQPIIWETAPTYRNLFGTIEKVRTPNGDWITDHMHIKGGSLMRANGGILVVDALDLLIEPGVWAALKRTLRNRSVEILSFDPLNIFAGVSLKPEAVPISVKVIMLGTRQIYSLLYYHDEDFRTIFKVKSEFAMFTERSAEELDNYACFVYKKVKDDDLPPFRREAVAAVVEHGVRLAGDLDKLTTRFTVIADLIREAGYWARRAGADSVDEGHVRQALRKRIERVSLFEELLYERIVDGTVLIDFSGSKVGQINGLALLDQGDHTFAQPARITASTAVGRHGIIDIDREAEMSGTLHTKGVLILSGFLRSRFAQNKPLALTASLTFEQSYGGIDGDSASSAELYALISSLSGVPLRQGIAVTGSVNQKGEIQPIGGVNRKIEGFFDLCRLVGMTGEQGVLIPKRNERNLMLREEVVEAVREGRFHVWSVETIEQGLGVLTDVEPGQLGGDGRYPEGSIYRRVDDRLARLAEEVRKYGNAAQ
ncbi:MAG TPA: ATP-binding protein [Candidatus Polarisedimenticolaceae bacterium]|nr:ATP-binding protein [Candidatus Polarisedimenticolaceae bacterium]